MALQRRVDALLDHVPLVDGESLSANVPVRRQARRQREVDISVAEPALDSLLEALDHVDPRRQPQHGNWRLPRLRNVKEVVEQSLPGVRGKQVKLVDHEDDRLGCHALLGLCDLGRVRQQSEQGRHGVGVVAGLLFFLVSANRQHSTSLRAGCLPC